MIFRYTPAPNCTLLEVSPFFNLGCWSSWHDKLRCGGKSLYIKKKQTIVAGILVKFLQWSNRYHYQRLKKSLTLHLSGINNISLFSYLSSGADSTKFPGSLAICSFFPLFLTSLLDCPVSWGCRIHWLYLCRGVRPPLTSVLDMTLNNLMVRFQQCWSLEECGVPLHCHRSQVHSGPEW